MRKPEVMSLRTLLRRAASLGAMCGAAISAVPARAAEAQCTAPIAIDLNAEWAQPRTTFRGWGTSLIWFASTTGNWPDPVRTRIADLLYGQDGLRWNIARYNIGGGRKPGTPPLSRPNANIPGMWRMPTGATGKDWWKADDPAMWDWSADAGQQWWLGAVRDRVDRGQLLLEAFSNSPPWFMTVSGDVSGAAKPLQPNLRPGYEEAFAEYLVRAMQGLEKRHGVTFHSIDPLNEPNTPYWYSGNRQEGSYFSPEGQARLLIATDKVLRRHGARTLLAAMDETNPDIFVRNWMAYDDRTKSVIRQLNSHSYSTTGSTGPRDIARATGLPLWMSEVDLSASNTVQDFDNVPSALALGEQIVLDLKRMEPEAWVLWQAVEPSAVGKEKGSNWGLLRTDMSVPRPADMSVHVTSKYWTMASFSRTIRPGYRLVRNDDPDTITALSGDGRTAVVVHVNHGPFDRRLTIASAGLPKGNWSVSEQLNQGKPVTPASCGATVAVAAKRSVTAVTMVRRD